MRVLQLGPFPPPNGGVQTNLKAIHDLLGARGHDAAAIAMTRASQVEGVPNVYKPRSIFALLKLLLTLKYDIVHFHIGGNLNVRLTMLMLVCGLLPNRKSVVTFHSGGYAAEAVHFARRFSLRGFAFRALDFVIGVNAQMLEMFRRYGVRENKTALILPFVLQKAATDLEIPAKLSEFIEQHRPFLLTVSGFEEEYGIALQIEAMERILEKFPNAGLMILGWGSLEENLRELIGTKKYAENILLMGDIDREIALHMIDKADIMLRPTHYDGDAISVREALFLQTPVIATDNGMRPPGVNLIASPPTIENLVGKIFEVLSEKAEKTTVKNSDNQTNASGLENIEAVLGIYEQLCQRS